MANRHLPIACLAGRCHYVICAGWMCRTPLAEPPSIRRPQAGAAHFGLIDQSGRTPVRKPPFSRRLRPPTKAWRNPHKLRKRQFAPCCQQQPPLGASALSPVAPKMPADRAEDTACLLGEVRTGRSGLLTGPNFQTILALIGGRLIRTRGRIVQRRIAAARPCPCPCPCPP